MKSIKLLGVLVALAIPAAAIAQERSLAKDYLLEKNINTSIFNQSSLYTKDTRLNNQSPKLIRANWFVGADGLTYSNICQTRYFWVAFNQFYLVDSGCTAYLQGYGTANGYMVQR